MNIIYVKKCYHKRIQIFVSVSKSPKELHSKEMHSQNNDVNNEIEVPKDIYLQKKYNKLLMN